MLLILYCKMCIAQVFGNFVICHCFLSLQKCGYLLSFSGFASTFLLAASKIGLSQGASAILSKVLRCWRSVIAKMLGKVNLLGIALPRLRVQTVSLAGA